MLELKTNASNKWFLSTSHKTEDLHYYQCIVNKVVWGVMCASIMKFAGCLIRTQLWSAEAVHKKIIWYTTYPSHSITS